MRKVSFLGLAAFGGAMILNAQTQIDLRAQAKPSTAPIKSGTAFPSKCLSGDLFVKTDAPSSANLFACVAPNTWVVQTGTGAVSVLTMANGVTVGSRPVQNFISGPGLVRVLSDTGARIDIQDMADTAILLTRSNAQTGADVLCLPAGRSGTAYTCSLPVALSSYPSGMVLRWIPDAGVNPGGATLAVDGLTPVPLKLPDGVSDLRPGDVTAGRMAELWFDGTVFRLLVPPAAGEGSIPVCNSSLRGRLWYTQGNSGVKDQFAVCAKDASEQYAWRSIY